MIVFVSLFLLPMAAHAVLLFLDVEALLPVVTLAAEITLGDLAHIHFVGSLGHLENLVMTPGAFQTLSVHVFLVAENDGRGIFGRKGQISPPDFLGKSTKWNRQTHQNH